MSSRLCIEINSQTTWHIVASASAIEDTAQIAKLQCTAQRILRSPVLYIHVFLSLSLPLSPALCFCFCFFFFCFPSECANLLLHVKREFMVCTRNNENRQIIKNKRRNKN